MSILETFMILFESDASDVQRGTDEANKSAETLDKTLEKIGLTTDGMTDSMKEFTSVALGSLAAFLSLGGALGGAIEKAEEIDALARAADALNMPIEDIDAWGKAAERAGGDAEGLRDSLTDLAEKMGEAAADAKSGAAESFKDLGIDLKNTDGSSRNAAQGMLDLADAVSTLSREQAIFRIKELGVTDNRTVDLILKGRAAIESMIKTQKEFGVITKQDAEIAQKFKLELDGTKSMFGSLADRAAISLMPMLTDLLKGIENLVMFFSRHKDAIKTFFVAGGSAIAAYYTPAMLAAAKATLAATWPLLLIGAAVAAFVLLLDDFNNYLEGNVSLIGKLSQEYPVMAEALKGVGAAFKIIWDLGSILLNLLWDLFTNPLQAISNMTQSLAELWDWFVKFFGIDQLTKQFVAGFQSMKDQVIGIWDSVVSYITGAWDKVTSILPDSVKTMLGIESSGSVDAQSAPSGSGGGDLRTLQQQAQSELAAASSSPLAAHTSNSLTSSTRQVNKSMQFSIEKIEVNTQATDAEGVAQGIGNVLDGHFSSAFNEFDDGVDY